MSRIEKTKAIIENYFDAFCKKDWDRFFACVDEHVIHDLANGPREIGKAAFRAYMTQRIACYDEQVEELDITLEPPGDEAEVEYDLVGTYIKTDGQHPPANGQTYRLSVGAFLLVKGGKITRISSFYDAYDWVTQIKRWSKNTPSAPTS